MYKILLAISILYPGCTPHYEGINSEEFDCEIVEEKMRYLENDPFEGFYAVCPIFLF